MVFFFAFVECYSCNYKSCQSELVEDDPYTKSIQFVIFAFLLPDESGHVIQKRNKKRPQQKITSFLSVG